MTTRVAVKPLIVLCGHVLLLFLSAKGFAVADEWPALPARSGTVNIPAQEWPLRPGLRTVSIEVFYPGGELAKVNSTTGILLSLHNWGGTGSIGTADPKELADRYNVIAITVDYLQSGPTKAWREPYDFGYLQALDALRALYYVYHNLQTAGTRFDSQRIFATGGSGGGNVALMCNKLAPRTFACVVELSGMTKLSDDIAYNLPGGTELNANYSKDPQDPNYLSPDAQKLRFVGDSSHLHAMQSLGASCKIIVVHGVDDASCPVKDAKEMVENMRNAKIDVDAHFIDQAQVDGKIYRDTGHLLGNRTLIVQHVAGKYLLPGTPQSKRRSGESDFDLRDELVRYQTENGEFVISYKNGYPVGRFEGTTK